MSGNFFKDDGGGGLRAPGPQAGGFSGVEDHPRDVEGAGRGIGSDGVRAEGLIAPIGELAEGHRGGGAAGEIRDAVGSRQGRRGELFREHWDEVAWVEAIADLMAVSAEADVFERALAEVGVEPIGEDALVSATELAGTGKDAAAVDKHRKIKGRAVFEGEGFAGEFGGAVE